VTRGTVLSTLTISWLIANSRSTFDTIANLYGGETTNSVLARSRFNSDDGAIPRVQAAVFTMRLMITSTWGRMRRHEEPAYKLVPPLADFPLLIAVSEFQITSVRERQSIRNFGHHFPERRSGESDGCGAFLPAAAHTTLLITASKLIGSVNTSVYGD
jgi:hypothetical protein